MEDSRGRNMKQPQNTEEMYQKRLHHSNTQKRNNTPCRQKTKRGRRNQTTVTTLAAHSALRPWVELNMCIVQLRFVWGVFEVTHHMWIWTFFPHQIRIKNAFQNVVCPFPGHIQVLCSNRSTFQICTTSALWYFFPPVHEIKSLLQSNDRLMHKSGWWHR